MGQTQLRLNLAQGHRPLGRWPALTSYRRVVVLDVSRRRRRRPSVVIQVELVACPRLEHRRRRRRRRPSDSRRHPQSENSCHPRTPTSTPPEVLSWPLLIPNPVIPSSSARRCRCWLCPTAVSVGGVAAELVVGGVVRWSVVTARRRGEGEAYAGKEGINIEGIEGKGIAKRKYTS